MTPTEQINFDRLLVASQRHHQLRVANASIKDLSQSRRTLDEARLRACRARRR